MADPLTSGYSKTAKQEAFGGLTFVTDDWLLYCMHCHDSTCIALHDATRAAVMPHVLLYYYVYATIHYLYYYNITCVAIITHVLC